MAVQQQAHVRRRVNWELHYEEHLRMWMAPWCEPISTLLGLGENPEGEALGRRQGGLSTKVYLRAEGGGKLITLVLTPGQRHEAPVFPQLMAQGAVKGAKGRPRLRPRRAVGDKGYSSRAIRRYARQHGIRITIPRKVNECRKGSLDLEVYKQRNLVERLINRLKQFRRLATRYEKRAANYRVMWIIAATLLWL